MSELPKIVLQRLHARDTDTGIHPDPDLINAFVEASLTGTARDQLMNHFADCAECREVAFLARPDQAATVVTKSPAANWLPWPVLRWGAALAGIAVVVAAVSLHHGPSGATPSVAVSATDAPKAMPNAAANPSSEQNLVASAPAAPAPAMTNSPAEPRRPRHDDQLKRDSRADSSMLAKPSPAQADDTLSSDARDATPQTVEVTAQAVSTESNSIPGKAKDAANQPILSAGGVGGGALGGAGATPRPRSALFPPNGSPRWTLTADGMLQRSYDFGRSWQTIPVADQVAFRALAANGKDIWVGGSKGALYHSSDAGKTWTQVQPIVAGQILSHDVIGVEFPDPQHGQLTTSNKEIWATDDGGQNWRRP